MKKAFKTILVLCLTSLIFASCNNKSDKESDVEQTESVTETESETETETATETESVTATETETETETQTESETETQTESETETQTESETETQTESETETQTESETETETSTETEAATETEALTEAEPASETESEPATEAVSETLAESSTETATETPAETETETEPETAAEEAWKADYDSAVWIDDSEWHQGFKIACNSHPNRTVICGRWKLAGPKILPKWQIGQWGTWKSYSDHSAMNCIFENRLESDENVLTNGINTMIYNKEENSLTMAIDTYEFYDGEPHRSESSWPHFLIESGMTSKTKAKKNPRLYSLACDKLILEMDIRLTDFEHRDFGGVNALQLLSFYYMVSQKDNGFVWFAVPMFDDRGYSDSESDTAVSLGDGTYIYGCGQSRLFENTLPSGKKSFYDMNGKLEPSDEWIHIELDLMPRIKMGEQMLFDKVYTESDSLSDLYFGGMNFGYEIHGSYKSSIEIKNYSLTAYSLKESAEEKK